MKTDNSDRSLIQSTPEASATFGLSDSADDVTHLMAVLRSGLYSDKILAVLREYGANGWDANRQSGNGDKAISVHVPTHEDPTLRIRDFGPGLSESDVLSVFTKYGKSTKRDTNEAVGSLGIGSKSGFAYSESFTVTSWFNGIKSVYIAVLDKSNRGKMDKVYSGASEEPNGLEISLPVRPADISAFESKAIRLFQHFDPRPAINVSLPELAAETVRLQTGTIVPKADEDDGSVWVAVMGCIPYAIDLEEIPADRLNKCLRKMNGSLKFPIGAVDFAASREHLEYTDRTKLALADQFDALIDEYVLQALTLMDSSAISAWEKRMRLYVLDGLDIEIPESYKSFAGHRVQIIDPGATPERFTLTHNKASVGSVTVSPKLRFVIDDTKKSLKNYDLTVDDYVVRATARFKLEDLEARLGEILAATNLAGVSVVRLSSLPYTPRTSRNNGLKNIKHKQSLFEFSPAKWYKRPYSRFWNGVDRVPTDQDVFVILWDFNDSTKTFYRDFERDQRLCSYFNVSMPTIYGYKATQKKPRTAQDLPGMEYTVWRRGLVENLLTPENLAKIRAYDNWQAVQGFLGYYVEVDGRRVNGIAGHLGEDHFVTKVLRLYQEAKKASADNGAIEELRLRAKQLGLLPDTVTADFDSIALGYSKQYPLSDTIRHLVNDRGQDSTWKDHIRYIKLVDADNARIQLELETKNQNQKDATQNVDSVHAN